jgi:predicted nucleic acid-binding protein
MLWERKTGCLSTQALEEFYVTVTRKAARTLVLYAIALHRRAGIAFWEAPVLQSGSRLGCHAERTEDGNPRQVIGGIRVLNPFACSGAKRLRTGVA